MATPTGFGLNITHFFEEGYVRVSWTGTPSANHYSYRVYRQDPGETTWKLIRERSDTSGTYTYDDYAAPVGSVKYVVVEVTAAGSVQTEETNAPKTVDLASPYYWIIHPDDDTYNIQLRSVYGDEFGKEREEEVKKLMGRGRKVDVGDDYGQTGSLSGRIYNTPTKSARQVRLDFEAAKDTFSWFYLRSPFGDLWKVWIEDPKFSRVAGFGTSEFVDFSCGYFEVA